MTFSEFLDWVAYFQIEFKRVDRTDIRYARICEVMNQSMGGHLTAQQVLEGWDLEEKRQETPEELTRKLMNIFGDTRKGIIDGD